MGIVWLRKCVCMCVCVRERERERERERALKGILEETSCEDGQRKRHSLLVVTTTQRSLHYLVIHFLFALDCERIISANWSIDTGVLDISNHKELSIHLHQGTKIYASFAS